MELPKRLLSKKAKIELIKWLEYHAKREHKEYLDGKDLQGSEEVRPKEQTTGDEVL